MTKTENIEKLMSLFDITMDLPNQKQYAFGILDKNAFINVNILKNEIIEAIKDNHFPWVDLALKTDLVYTSNYYKPPSHEFNKTSLLHFLNFEVSFNFSDEILSDNEIQILNKLISKIDIHEGALIQDFFLEKNLIG